MGIFLHTPIAFIPPRGSHRPYFRFTAMSAVIALVALLIGCGRNASLAGGDRSSGKPAKEVDASALEPIMRAIEPHASPTGDAEDDIDMSVEVDEADADAKEEADEGTSSTAIPETTTPETSAPDTTTPETGTAAPAGTTREIILGDPSLTAGIPGDGPLTPTQAQGWLDDPTNHEVLEFTLPPGLAAAEASISGVEENPLTRAKIELGRQLYFDPRLSSDSTVSCATCHHPDEGYARHTRFGEGVKGQQGNRNSPVSYNRIVSGPQFWDGRAASLEEQAKGPVANPIEMGNTHEACVRTIQTNPTYQLQFERVFPGEGITIDTIAKAIATFERALVTGPAPYDHLEIVRAMESQYDAEELTDLAAEDPELHARYLQAKSEVDRKMSRAAIRGRDLFFDVRANCTACHAGANFTDEKYHNLGVGMDVAEPDLGRFTQTQLDADRGAFKTPGLRNVASSAPYMHDGSQETLEEVVKWYAQGGHPNPHLSDKVKKLDLTPEEEHDLVAFMREGLSCDFPKVCTTRLPE